MMAAVLNKGLFYVHLYFVNQHLFKVVVIFLLLSFYFSVSYFSTST